MAREPGDETLLPFEEDLSAFLDGELDSDREAEIRAALAANPVLAARLEALASVDAELRASEAPAVPADLHARLRARIAAGEATAHQQLEARPGPGRAARAPGRRRRRLSAPLLATAAVAAAVALFVLVRRPVEDLPPERIVEIPAPQLPEAVPAPRAPEVVPAPPAPELVPLPEIAPPALEESVRGADPLQLAAPSDPPTPRAEPVAPLREEPEVIEVPAVEVAEAATAEPVDLDAASEEEIELAMDWELLEDLDLIGELDLLEAMARRAARGQG